MNGIVLRLLVDYKVCRRYMTGRLWESDGHPVIRRVVKLAIRGERGAARGIMVIKLDDTVFYYVMQRPLLTLPLESVALNELLVRVRQARHPIR